MNVPTYSSALQCTSLTVARSDFATYLFAKHAIQPKMLAPAAPIYIM